MAAPTSAVHICNLALDRLGQGPIASITVPTTPAEDRCALHYDQTRREVLRDFIFNFAKKLVVLTEDTSKTPAHGFGTAYRLPNDCLKLLAIGDVSINDDTPAGLYELSEGYIFTDAGDDDGLKLTYSYDCTTITKYDSLFIKLFKLQLAANMAVGFTLKPSLLTGLYAELEAVSQAAASAAGQEKPPRHKTKSKWVAARTRGRSRDLRYI